MRRSEPGGSVAVSIVASVRRVAELGSLVRMRLGAKALEINTRVTAMRSPHQIPKRSSSQHRSTRSWRSVRRTRPFAMSVNYCGASSWCRTPAVVEARATASAIRTMCATDLDAAPGDYAA